MYKNVEDLHITQEDIQYLDNVDFSKFESITRISIENCYGLDGSKIIPNRKVELSISNSVLDLSKFDFSKFENITNSATYDIGNSPLSPDAISFNGLINSEYNINEKYDDKLNTIAKEIYLKSSNVEDIIENVTLYVVNNIEYDFNGTFLKLQLAESIFEHKMGVCAHYAYLESQLLNRLGIFSIDISGYTDPSDSKNSSHAWVIAYVNDEWYGIDPTWIDEGNKIFNEISKDNQNYMVKLSGNNSSFNQFHYPNFTLHDAIPVSSRISKMSIIDDINKEDSITNNGSTIDNSSATIVEVEDTGMYISDIQNIIGLIFIGGGLLIIVYVLFKEKRSIIKVFK